MVIPEKLLSQIISFVRDLSATQVEKTYELLMDTQDYEWAYLRLILRTGLPLDYHWQSSQLIDVWEKECPEVSSQSVALAILSASRTSTFLRGQQNIELVWTGPDSHIIPLRRMDQVLLELIDQSQRSLWIVCFAVYRIERVITAIWNAAGRGVRVNLLIENEEDSQGRLSFDILASLRGRLEDQVNFYIWPIEQRPLSSTGNPGVLHAKVAVADSKSLLISSANLTEYAMQLNIEMGVLINGGDAPIKTERHFDELISSRVFRKR